MVVCRQCGTANEPEKVRCFKCKTELIAPHMIGKTPCFTHANREAVTQCSVCAEQLCERCQHTLDEVDYCERCAPEGAINTEHDEDYEEIPVLDSVRTERAGIVSRAVALIVDGLLGVLFGIGWAFVLAMVNGGSTKKFGYNYLHLPSKPSFWIFWGVTILMGFIYNTVLIAMNGQTLGKYLMGIIVLQADGKIANLQNALARTFGTLLSVLPFGAGYWWAFKDENHETWHDKLSNTAAFRYEDTL